MANKADKGGWVNSGYCRREAPYKPGTVEPEPEGWFSKLLHPVDDRKPKKMSRRKKKPKRRKPRQ